MSGLKRIGLVACFAAPLASASSQTPDFARDVWPILEARCITCHRETHRDEGGRLRAPKAGLRLDGKAWILKGSDAEPVLVPGNAARSPLVRRIALAGDHPDVMPPKGDPLSVAQVATLRAWVEGGADFGGFVGAPGPGGPSERAGERPRRERLEVYERLAQGLAAASPDLVRRVAGERARITPLWDGSPLLRVEFPSRQDEVDDRVVRDLAPLAAHVAVLDLARTRIGDGALAHLARCANLVELDVHETNVGARGLAALGALPNLTRLNLHHTAVDDDGLAILAGLPGLRTVHLWESAVTEAGVARLRGARPDVRVHHRIDLPDPPAPVEEPNPRRRRRD